MAFSTPSQGRLECIIAYQKARHWGGVEGFILRRSESETTSVSPGIGIPSVTSSDQRVFGTGHLSSGKISTMTEAERREFKRLR